MKEFRGEEALDVLAEILEPAALIMADSEIADLYRSGQTLRAVKYAIKNHKQQVIEIMAAMDGKDPKQYVKSIGIFTLPVKAIELLNMPDVQNLFSLQGQMMEDEHSGSATENTEEKEQ